MHFLEGFWGKKAIFLSLNGKKGISRQGADGRAWKAGERVVLLKAEAAHVAGRKKEDCVPFWSIADFWVSTSVCVLLWGGQRGSGAPLAARREHAGEGS